MEVFARIRRDARVESLSTRELARRHGVGRPTVRQALAQAEPPARKPLANAVAYSLDDTITPVELVAADFGDEIGRMAFNLK